MRPWTLGGAGGAAGYASADFVWLLDSRDSSARVAWRGGADGSSHEVRYTQSARQGQQIRQHTASLGSLALVGVAYEALMACYSACSECVSISSDSLQAHSRPHLAMPPQLGDELAMGLRSHGQPCQRSLRAVQ